MFKSQEKNLINILAPVNRAAGKRIRRFPKNVQEDAWMVGYLAYLEGKDINEALTLWNRKERRYQKKILAFTRARPLKCDKQELKDISKKYR